MDIATNPFDCPDGTVILEPRAVYDRGLIGYCPSEQKLIYSYDLLLQALIDSGETYTDAVEWLDYNTIGSNLAKVVYDAS
jgi:hypothetical protein